MRILHIHHNHASCEAPPDVQRIVNSLISVGFTCQFFLEDDFVREDGFGARGSWVDLANKINLFDPDLIHLHNIKHAFLLKTIARFHPCVKSIYSHPLHCSVLNPNLSLTEIQDSIFCEICASHHTASGLSTQWMRLVRRLRNSACLKKMKALIIQSPEAEAPFHGAYSGNVYNTPVSAELPDRQGSSPENRILFLMTSTEADSVNQVTELMRLSEINANWTIYNPTFPSKFIDSEALQNKSATNLEELENFRQAVNRCRFAVVYHSNPGFFRPAIGEIMGGVRPFITFKKERIDDLVIPNITGMIASSGSIKETAVQMKTLCNTPDHCQKMGENAHAIIQSKSGVKFFLRRLIRAYEEILSEEAEEPADWEDPFDGMAVQPPIEDSIDLHTYAADETREVLEAYVEEAVEKGFLRVRIIHGRGSGVQRKIVQSWLNKSPYVEAVRDANSEEGGWGATIAYLRRF